MDRFPKHRFLPYGRYSIVDCDCGFDHPLWASDLSVHRVSPFGKQLRYVGWRNFVDVSLSEYLSSFQNADLLCSGHRHWAYNCLDHRRPHYPENSWGQVLQVAFIWTYAMSPIIAGVMVLIFDPSIGIRPMPSLLLQGIESTTSPIRWRPSSSPLLQSGSCWLQYLLLVAGLQMCRMN